MRIAVTSFALVRQFASVAVVGNLTVYRDAMELPHSHDGKKHVPVPTGKLLIYKLIVTQNKWLFIKGRYVVGCTDLMIGPSQEDGCFLRIYYPSQLKDTHVNK